MTKAMTQLSIATCITLIFAGISFSEDVEVTGDAWFKQLDANSDEQVSKQEYLDIWNAWFSRRDVNDDKHLSYEEWAGTGQVSSDSSLRGAFATFDKDEDGEVSAKEHVAVRTRLFDASDLDNDGYWSLSEASSRARKK